MDSVLGSRVAAVAVVARLLRLIVGDRRVPEAAENGNLVAPATDSVASAWLPVMYSWRQSINQDSTFLLTN